MDSDPDVIHLRIKSFKDVELDVPAGSVVAHLKQQVRSALGAEADEYLRLICKGRLLLPDDHPIQDFNVKDGDVVHAVLAEKTSSNNVPRSTPTSGTVVSMPEAPSSASSNRNQRRRRQRQTTTTTTTSGDEQAPRGTMVGPGGRVTRRPLSREGGDSDSDSDSSMEIYDEEAGRLVPRERLGFDQLRGPRNQRTSSSSPSTSTSNPSGMTRSEITVIRGYFSGQVDRYAETHPEAHTDESDPLRRRLLIEEDWMAAQGPLSEFRLNLNANSTLRQLASSLHNSANAATTARAMGGRRIGTDRDFLWGFMLGFFVGFAMMVWVWMPTIPHKQKLGILTGITFQILLYNPPEELDEFDVSNELP